ncbi:hypothetical protein [Actinophytocola sp.]|uniref:hypothetical protein n=1 Tax=Actinophytocola sp. TaxID=1872138 RepID=UPI002D27011C|nr:hypothetical protein [Actinophytocola sp.]HYQ65652.1 hypothetical protein [Actinophytocola sp.]
MSHEGGPEQPQRTVAELLAKYGADAGNQPRRRRRRADDMGDTGAQQIIDRVMSESGEMQAIRDDMPPPERTSHRRGAERSGYQRQITPRGGTPGQQSSQRIPRPLPPQPSQQMPRPQPAPSPGPGQQSSSRMPSGFTGRVEPPPVRDQPPPRPAPQPSRQMPRPQPSQRMPMPPPPGGTRDRSGIRSRLDGDLAPPVSPPLPTPPSMAGPSAETTEELPRVPGRVPVDGSMSGRRPMPPADVPTQYAPAYDPYAEPEESGYRNAYPPADPDERYDTGERSYPGDRYDSAQYDNLLDDDDLRRDRDRDRDRDDLDDLDELEDLEDDDLDGDRERSPVREWLIMLAQLALGVIGGAAVWLGFNWLWGFLPAAALVVALVVTTGLVLIVRKIRKAEDLQTTVLAVLVGLVVTVSPAALLLLNR